MLQRESPSYDEEDRGEAPNESTLATDTEAEAETVTPPSTKPTKLRKMGRSVSFDSNASDGSSPPRLGDKAYETDGQSKKNRRLGSFSGSLSRDSGWVPDDDGVDEYTTYVDSDLKHEDMVPMDEQDEEHNWDALNARILERMNQEHKWMVKHHIVHPMGPFRKRWDAIQVVLLAYVAMLVPCECRVPCPCDPTRLTSPLEPRL